MKNFYKIKTSMQLSGFTKRMIFLVFLLVLYSCVSTLPQTIMAISGIGKAKILQGGNVLQAEGGFFFRIIRELILGIILFYSCGHFLVSKRQKTIKLITATVFIGIFCWILVTAWISFIVYELPAAVVLLGIRTFQYVVLTFIGYYITINSSQAVLIQFANLLRWYAGLLIALGIIQVLFQIGPANITFWGIRAFGPFPNYNLYGLTMASCGLTFLLANIAHNDLYKRSKFLLWFLACLIMTIFSGSRGAILISLGCGVYFVYTRVNVYLKGTILISTPIAALAVFALISSQAVSGRNIQLMGDNGVSLEVPRIEKWKNTIDNADELHKVFFGWGLGLTSLATTTVYGKDIFKGQSDAHSAYLTVFGNLGGVGLFIFLILILNSYKTTPKLYGQLFFAFIFLIMIPYGIWEFFPVNVILLFLWGCLNGIGTLEKQQTDPSFKLLYL